ncbi:hypothetical protein F5I97DRAFT_1274383 [Phlebopus sp. FC_14]|nr:hypothetical protein F5I97DRAFT_1274383 [Phlebopus sp. FC_14]
MTRHSFDTFLKLLKWLLRFAANRLRRLLLIFATLFTRLRGAAKSPCFLKTVGTVDRARTGGIVGSVVPSVSVTTDRDPDPTTSLPDPHNSVPPIPSTPALHTDYSTQSERSGYSSSLSLAVGGGNPMDPSSRMQVPSPTIGPALNDVPMDPTYPPLPMPSTTPAISVVGGDRSAPLRELRPFGASQIDRYDRKVLIKMHRSPVRIRALQRVFQDPTDPSVKTPWISCTHPEGALYFYHTERRVFTDSDIRRTRNLDAIEDCSHRLFQSAKQNGLNLPDSNIELALELSRDETTKRKVCLYYFVDLERKLLFWLEDFDPSGMYGNVRGVKEPTHIKCALEMQYWWHCELYPYDRVLQSATFYELRGLIIHANAESVTSDTSLAPFETGELSKMMDIMNVLEGTIGQPNDHLMCVVARFMRMFMRIQFFNFHGQLGARLDVDQSVYETPQERARISLLLRIVNVLLFGAPVVHAKGLKGVWVDMTIVQRRWKAFVSNVTNEWAGFTVYSTVMLAVNVSFLSVPGIDLGQSGHQPSSAIAIYLSILCAVGSLVASVILSGQSQRTAYNTANATAEYMSTMTTTLIGIDHLAIMYSVPYGLLMWGMLFFITALSLVIFRSPYPITLIITGTGMAVIAVFTFWPIWGGTERYLMDPELLMEELKNTWMFKSMRGRETRRQKGSRVRKKGRSERSGSVSSAGGGGGSDTGNEDGHKLSRPSSVV